MTVLENVRCEAKFVGDTVKWEHIRAVYDMTLKYKGRSESFRFYQGTTADKPVKKDILYCILSDRNYTTMDDMMGLGFDMDDEEEVEKAKKLIKEIKAQNKKLNRLFTEEEMRELDEALEDY